MRGRPHKPTEMKVIEGTFRNDRANLHEPDYETEIPECPVALSPEAKEEWDRITPMLEVMGLIAKVNRASLAAYCSLYARWIQMEREIIRDGNVVKVADRQRGDDPFPRDKDTGELIYFSYVVNPLLRASLACVAEMRKYAGEFGLTPASQAKVNAAPKENKSKKAKTAERFFN